MPVKCLNATEKADIGNKYLFFGNTISSLSYEYKRSRRTIIRVLEERGIAPTRLRQKKEYQQVVIEYPLFTLPPYGRISPVIENSPQPVPTKPIPTKTPWYRRLKEWLFGTPEQQEASKRMQNFQ
jgi:hypothetical protein